MKNQRLKLFNSISSFLIVLLVHNFGGLAFGESFSPDKTPEHQLTRVIESLSHDNSSINDLERVAQSILASSVEFSADDLDRIFKLGRKLYRNGRYQLGRKIFSFAAQEASRIGIARTLQSTFIPYEKDCHTLTKAMRNSEEAALLHVNEEYQNGILVSVLEATSLNTMGEYQSALTAHEYSLQQKTTSERSLTIEEMANVQDAIAWWESSKKSQNKVEIDKAITILSSVIKRFSNSDVRSESLVNYDDTLEYRRNLASWLLSRNRIAEATEEYYQAYRTALIINNQTQSYLMATNALSSWSNSKYLFKDPKTVSELQETTRKAHASYRKSHQNALSHQATSALANSFVKQNHYELAISTCLDELEWSRDNPTPLSSRTSAWTNNLLSLYYTMADSSALLGQFESSQTYLSEGNRILSDPSIQITASNKINWQALFVTIKANTGLYQHDFQTARKYYKEALTFRASNDPYSLNHAQCLASYICCAKEDNIDDEELMLGILKDLSNFIDHLPDDIADSTIMMNILGTAIVNLAHRFQSDWDSEANKLVLELLENIYKFNLKSLDNLEQLAVHDPRYRASIESINEFTVRFAYLYESSYGISPRFNELFYKARNRSLQTLANAKQKLPLTSAGALVTYWRRHCEANNDSKSKDDAIQELLIACSVYERSWNDITQISNYADMYGAKILWDNAIYTLLLITNNGPCDNRIYDKVLAWKGAWRRKQFSQSQQKTKPLLTSDICVSLGKKRALLDFVIFNAPTDKNQPSTSTGIFRDQFLGVFTTRQGLPTSFSVLGRWSSIRESIARWKRRLLEGFNIENDSISLYKTLIPNVVRELDEIETIFICPDGGIDVLSFKILKESYSKHTLRFSSSANTTFAYVAFPAEKTKRSRMTLPGKLLVVGDVDYGIKQSIQNEKYGNAQLYWQTPPRSHSEINSVILTEKWNSVEKLIGKSATVERYLSISELADIHVISTHGTYKRKSELNNKTVFDHPSILSTGIDIDFVSMLKSSVNSSYLVFAGANLAPASNSSKFLSASRISNLKFHNTDLVVLSACDSALGDLILNEGNLSITSAYLEAGVQGVVSCVWPVDDRVAELFVKTFFETHGARPQNRLNAFQTASRKVRNSHTVSNILRSRPGPPQPLTAKPQEATLVKKELPPRYWAPFRFYFRSIPLSTE